MSDAYETPEAKHPASPTMPTWKRVLLKSLGVGLGVGLGLAIAIAVFVWYSSRPVPPKPWNANAITASFMRVDTVGEDNHLRFLYILENDTEQDYRVKASELLLSAVVLEKDSLTGDSSELKFDTDTIFIPAKQHAQVGIELLGYKVSPASDRGNNTPDERKKYYNAVLSYVASYFPRLNGFAAYDDAHRYRINFPNGWRQTR